MSQARQDQLMKWETVLRPIRYQKQPSTLSRGHLLENSLIPGSWSMLFVPAGLPLIWVELAEALCQLAQPVWYGLLPCLITDLQAAFSAMANRYAGNNPNILQVVIHPSTIGFFMAAFCVIYHPC